VSGERESSLADPHGGPAATDIATNSIVFNNNEIGTQNNPNLITPIDRIHAKNTNKKERSFKLLGILLDENLSFNDNTNFLCNKLAKSIFILNQAKNFLTPKALKTLYFSLVHPHLLYCINIYSCTSQANLNRIYKLQKKLSVSYLMQTPQLTLNHSSTH
jgi:hypothetical protein